MWCRGDAGQVDSPWFNPPCIAASSHPPPSSTVNLPSAAAAAAAGPPSQVHVERSIRPVDSVCVELLVIQHFDQHEREEAEPPREPMVFELSALQGDGRRWILSKDDHLGAWQRSAGSAAAGTERGGRGEWRRKITRNTASTSLVLLAFSLWPPCCLSLRTFTRCPAHTRTHTRTHTHTHAEPKAAVGGTEAQGRQRVVGNDLRDGQTVLPGLQDVLAAPHGGHSGKGFEVFPLAVGPQGAMRRAAALCCAALCCVVHTRKAEARRRSAGPPPVTAVCFGVGFPYRPLPQPRPPR